MLKPEMQQIIEAAKPQGWVLEPDAKAVMAQAGLDIPVGVVTASVDEAKRFLKEIKTPVVIKAVSKMILHKTEHQAVVTGITEGRQLEEQMARLLGLDGCESVLVEQMVAGIEVIVGAKTDYQFGPVVVFGPGGIAVEIYNDTAIRMAPLKSGDVFSMVESLKAKQVLRGYRGSPGVNMEILTRMLVNFSYLMMDLEKDVSSIDLNPVMCTADRCVIADARIILND